MIYSMKTALLTSVFVLLNSVCITANADLFNAYPGTYKATLLNIEAANIINLSADVWSGYPKKIRVTLPNIAVPEPHSKSLKCEIELAQQALNFTREFLSKAEKIQVQDIYMNNTQEDDASTQIYTEEGSLAAQLLINGFARPASIPQDKPWC